MNKYILIYELGEVMCIIKGSVDAEGEKLSGEIVWKADPDRIWKQYVHNIDFEPGSGDIVVTANSVEEVIQNHIERFL